MCAHTELMYINKTGFLNWNNPESFSCIADSSYFCIVKSRRRDRKGRKIGAVLRDGIL